MSRRKYFAIAVTTSHWFDEAHQKGIRVFQFPPKRRPGVGKLREGDPCVVYLTGIKEFAGEFRVKEVRKVSASEFKRFKDMAHEVPEAPFPKADEWSYVILFDKLIAYPSRVKKEEVPIIKEWRRLRGFSPVTAKHAEILDEIRKRAYTAPPEPEPNHRRIVDMICDIGKWRGDVIEAPYREMLLDVAWMEEPGASPYAVFEVQVGGNYRTALFKLGHAQRRLRSVPFLITTEKYEEKAKRLVERSFPDLKNVLRIVNWKKIKELHGMYKECYEFERKVGIPERLLQL